MKEVWRLSSVLIRTYMTLPMSRGSVRATGFSSRAASQFPYVALAELPLLNEPKFMRWLEQINGPQKSLANIRFVHDVIAQVAQNQPDEIAIEGEGVAVSYSKMLNGS